MIRARRTVCVCMVVLASCVFPLEAPGADWPMWRCDASRSAATTEELAEVLHLQWVRDLPALEPAWPDEPRMRFDVSYQPVVLGKTMFVGSPRSDSLTALDTDTGAVKWRFYAEGPIRLAPVAWQDRLYFACDDGCLYCLSAADGSLIWKFRGGPSDRKVLGNGRLISTWPARGAPVVADGTVYFAAGIWPFMGIFIYALDAESGQVVWVNDGTGAKWMQQPHGGALAFASVAPQGYLAAIRDRLVIPNGRAAPAVFERDTGEMLYYRLAENNRAGGFAAAAAGEYFFNRGNCGSWDAPVARDWRMYDLETGLLPGSLGSEPVLSDEVAYASGEGAVVAYDLASVEVKVAQDSQGREVRSLAIPRLWDFAAQTDRAWLRAGSRLFASKDRAVMAIELPAAGEEARISWQTEAEGTASAMLAADGKLFVVTLGGKILCFGPKEGEPRLHAEQPERLAPEDQWGARAREIMEQTGVREGYCLCVGVGSGRLMEELTRQSGLHVIGVDPDSDKIGRLRERFDGQGIYGTRVALIAGEPTESLLPPYFASLIVSEDLTAAGLGSGQRFAAKVFHSLRPYGGVACLRLPPGQGEAFEGWVAAAGLAYAVVTGEGEYTALRCEGALPGSADWTHQYADVANTGVSKDELVRAPLGLLWFGGSSNLSILPRHGHGPSEHVVAGRLYIEGPESLRAMDVYTGRVLWERELPGLGAPYDNTSHQPGANALGSNYASAPDGIYVAQGQRCLKLDPATGETVSELTLPPAEGQTEPQTWGYLGIHEGLLIAGASPIVFDGEQPMGRMDNWDGTSSKQVMALDRQSGEAKWALDSEYGFRHNAICAGGGKVFCIDRLPDAVVAKMERRGEEVEMEPRLTALDMRSGEVLWSTTENVFGTWLSYSEEHDLLLQAGRRSRDMLGDEPDRRMICYRGADGTVAWDRDHQYGGPPLLHGDTIITQGQAFGLLDGEPRTRRNPLTGAELPWQFQRMYGCNTAVGSQHLLTFRSGAAGFFDLAGDGGTGNLGGFKSGCTSNLIVANGVLNAPDYTRTCTCSYQNQTSLAFVHMPEVEMWTFSTFEMGEEPIERIGINLGAPGDRREEDGTLWLELPGGGSPSPEVSVRVEPEEVSWLRRHSSAIEGEGLAWVGASGGEGLRSVSVALAKEGAVARDYAVTLYFAEIGGMKAGERVLDVAIQGKQALEGLDIVKEAGGSNRVVAMEFREVAVTDELTVTLRAVRGETLLCGIKAVAEG